MKHRIIMSALFCTMATIAQGPAPAVVAELAPAPVATTEPAPVAVVEPAPVAVTNPASTAEPAAVAVVEPTPVVGTDPAPVAVEPAKESAPKAANPNVQKQFGLGVQFMNDAATLNIEVGLLLKQKHYHGISGYFPIYKEDHIGSVGGINYDYRRLFGKKFIRLDLGVTAGYNVYEEDGTISSNYDDYRTVTFGGPSADLNLFFGPIHLMGGYTYSMGYQEYGTTKEYEDMHVWNLSFGVGISKSK